VADPVLYQLPPVAAMQWDGTELNKMEILAWVAQTLTQFELDQEEMTPENGVCIFYDGSLAIIQGRQMARVNNTDYVVKFADGHFEVKYYEHFENDYTQLLT